MIGKILLVILLYPFFLVLYMPIGCAYTFAKMGQKELGCCAAVIFAPVGFVIGLILNSCFIPAVLIGTVSLFFVLLFNFFRCIFCYRCRCTNE